MLSAFGEALDAIGETVATGAGAAMGAISVVDQVWDTFLGAYGLPAPGPDPEVARPDRYRLPVEESLCQHVVSSGEVLALPDLTAAGEPPLRLAGREFRAYLGVPLRGNESLMIGAVCALDVSPRQWAPEHVAALQAVAATVTHLTGITATGTQLLGGRFNPTTLLDAIAEPFVAVDGEGMIVAWNAGAATAFGWLSTAVIGRPLNDVLFPGDDSIPAFAPAEPTAAQVGADGLTAALLRRHWVTAKDLRKTPFDITSRRVARDGETFTCLTFRDVSGEVTAQATADRHGGFLRALLDSLDTAVLASDADGRVAFRNQALSQLLCLPAELPDSATDVAAASLFDVDGSPLPAAHHPSARALAGHPVRDAELQVRLPGRPVRTMSANAARIQVDGEVLGAVVALHDITDQRRAQRLRECELAVSHALIESPSTAQAARRVTEALARGLGWAHAELWLVEPAEDALHLAAEWTRGAGRPAPAPEPAKRERGAPADDVVSVVWTTAAPVCRIDPPAGRSPGGAAPRPRAELAVPVHSGRSVLGVLLLSTDSADEQCDVLVDQLTGISSRIGQYLDRRRAEELTVELAHAKDDFLALVGHELRTPLTSITTYTQLLSDSPDSLATDGPALIGVIRRNTDSLTAIIDDLLDLAGLESGHVSLRPAEIDLADLTQEAIDTIRAAADDRNLQIRATVPSTLTVNADPQRLRQVLGNLLSNAVKYNNDHGSITVTLTDGDGEAHLAVTDTGIGIPPAERPRLFQRFFRSAAARDSGIPGTGLGLAVSRTIVEQHGGRLTALHHDPGTTLTVHLPTPAHA